MGAIEPGQQFTYEYAKGKSVTIVGKTFREQVAMAELEDEMMKCVSAKDAMEVARRAVRESLPAMENEKFEAFMDTINVTIANNIIAAVMGRLSEEERKKLVPLPS